MTDNPRLRQLLDELHESHATPEEVCRSCPELLPEVRARWRQMCRVRAELDALFPAPPGPGAPRPALPPERTAQYVSNAERPGTGALPSEVPSLPQIPGYEVEAVLGHGGMGVVFRARQLPLNRAVALKML